MNPRRSRGFGALLVLAALVLGACDQAGPSASASTGAGATSPGLGPAQLVTEAAVSATIGPTGGELTTTDRARGRSYRLTIPEGAFDADTPVTMTPIATIGGVDGLLGGVELEPAGIAFHDAPAMLEIGLDAEHATTLAGALKTDQAVTGFRYETEPAALHPALARASADGTTVTVPLVTFSGHGAGLQPSGPEMARFLAELNSPQRDDDALLARLRDWELAIEDALRAAVRYYDPGEWLLAYEEASLWHFFASNLEYLSDDKWYAPGDGLQPEASQLQVTIDDGWPSLVRDVNDDCPTDGAADLAELGIIWQQVLVDGWALPPFNQILSPATFCYGYELTANPAPVDLEEGQSQEIALFLDQLGTGTAATDAQLQAMGLQVTAVATDPSLVQLSGYRPATSQVRITAQALGAVPGNTDEGAFTLNVRVLGIEFYDVSTISFDITAGEPGNASCSGDPASVTDVDHAPPIDITFDGAGTCLVRIGVDSPDIIVEVDPDVDDVNGSLLVSWDAGPGSNWALEEPEVGFEGLEPGSYAFDATYLPTGARFTVQLTVDFVPSDAGPNSTLTVRDVSITPAGQGGSP